MSFGGLYVSMSGLRASKYALETTSHNISNANNPNYVRQSVMLADSPYKLYGGYGTIQQGTGVDVKSIRQIRDQFLDMQIRRELPGYGYSYAKAETLGDVEAIFNEITPSGLQDVMNDFWNNWNELYKDPDNLTIRALVHESTVAFTDTVNHIGNQLDNVRRNLNREISDKVGEANNILNQIVIYNKKIKLAEAEGAHVSANDFRDERNALQDELSQLIPVKMYEDIHGGTVVTLNGIDIVNGSYATELELKVDDISGFGNVYIKNREEKVDFNGKGEIGGYIHVRDTSIKEYEDRINTLVTEVANKINEAHLGGKGLDGSTNIPFFVTKGTKVNPDGSVDGTSVAGGTFVTDMKFTASNIVINPALRDLNKIAASEGGEVGDGNIAKVIYELRSLEIPKYGETDKKLSIDEFYRDLVTTLALERESSITDLNTQIFLLKSMDEKRDAVSKVSLDEEMADMIKFQHAYSANSRVINTIDEMIDTVVNRLGLVGR